MNLFIGAYLKSGYPTFIAMALAELRPRVERHDNGVYVWCWLTEQNQMQWIEYIP